MSPDRSDPTSDRAPGWYEIVRQNWQKTTAHLLADTEPCIKIRDDELEAIEENRVLVGLSFEALDAWVPSGSWMLAILLCPGDDLTRLISWAGEHEIDPSRVHFYLHPDTPWQILEPWRKAGYPTDRVDDDIDSWERLHRLFGLALSERIVKDWSDMSQ